MSLIWYYNILTVNVDGQVVSALSEAVDADLPVLVAGIRDDQRDRVVQAQVAVRVLEARGVGVVAHVQVAVAAEVVELHDDGIDGLRVKTVKVPLVVVDVAADLLAREQLAGHYTSTVSPGHTTIASYSLVYMHAQLVPVRTLFAVDTAVWRVTRARVAEHATAVHRALGGAVGDGGTVQGPREARVSEGVEPKVDPLVGHIYNLQAEVVVNASLGVVEVDARGNSSSLFMVIMALEIKSNLGKKTNKNSKDLNWIRNFLIYLNIDVNVAVGGLSDVPDELVGSGADFVVNPAVLGERRLVFGVRSGDSVDGLEYALEQLYNTLHAYYTYKQCSWRLPKELCKHIGQKRKIRGRHSCRGNRLLGISM